MKSIGNFKKFEALLAEFNRLKSATERLRNRNLIITIEFVKTEKEETTGENMELDEEEKLKQSVNKKKKTVDKEPTKYNPSMSRRSHD